MLFTKITSVAEIDGKLSPTILKINLDAREN